MNKIILITLMIVKKILLLTSSVVVGVVSSSSISSNCTALSLNYGADLWQQRGFVTFGITSKLERQRVNFAPCQSAKEEVNAFGVNAR